ncbi:MAG: hypothetical protein LZ163_01650 [Thaumarchaeota archaeon]|jgi:predicted ATP-dependent serine protease|nr:hypothetical protein [Candidatus Terraquivivens yellowstonensis]MCL7395147.1 hypothetical protein [Candidatus Terraquivivens yellowstonensis]MCL7400260.1 hypothetical protein [Candidatus Terraquivivens yellowstonensis]
MVKEVEKEGLTFYICEECGLAYKEKTWAEKCEKFCSEHHACSLEITSHAVKMDTLNF